MDVRVVATHPDGTVDEYHVPDGSVEMTAEGDGLGCHATSLVVPIGEQGAEGYRLHKLQTLTPTKE